MLFLHLILRSAKRVSKDEVAIDPILRDAGCARSSG
jgi:hypothetical protein